MRHNILKMTVDKAPNKFTNSADLKAQLLAIEAKAPIVLPPKRWCIMIHEVKNNSGSDENYLVFARIDKNGEVDMSDIVGFELPCPPVCHDDQITLSVLLE
jgi:hypothetical protein